MVLVALILTSGALLLGVGVLTAISFGLWKWLGKSGAICGAVLLSAAVAFMVWCILDTLRSGQNASLDTKAVMGWFAWGIGIPCALGALSALWMLRLATR